MLTRRKFIELGAMAGATLALGGGLSACSTGPSTKAADLQKAYEEGSADVQLFTDSCGRQVALPANITSISPSGSYAQILLCTLCPEKLVSLSSNFSSTQLKYLNSSVANLPVLGRFYGKNGDMNYEEIIKLAPNVIIDIGEHKDGIENDMNGLQEQTGLPVVFIQATMDVLPQAYASLGQMLGMDAQAAEKVNYIQGVLDFAAAHHDEIAAQGLKVMYSAGPNGYDVKEAGSVHAMPLQYLGVTNVAQLNGGSTEVSPEQVAIWAPDVLILSPADGAFDYIYQDDVWASVPAVANKRVFEVPGEPYEWMDKPPSVQTVLGLEWLGNLLYPEIYNFDMVARAQEFYQMFWGYSLSEAEARELLANSTLLGQ